MTGNEKKIAKIFSFIALAAAKLKFYPCGRELLFNLLSNSVVSICIMRRLRFQQCESALINVDKNFPIRALKNHTYNRATGFDPSVQGTQPIVRLAGAARPTGGAFVATSGNLGFVLVRNLWDQNLSSSEYPSDRSNEML